MKPFNKSETAIRMGLSRAVKAGLVLNIKDNGKVYYEIKENGLKIIEELKAIMSIYWKKIGLRKNTWNNFWCLVNLINIPKQLKRDVKEYLKGLGFGNLTQNCYIHPYDLSKEVEAKILELKADPYVKIFLAKLVSFSNPVQLAKNIWNFEELKKKYVDFINKYNQQLNPTNITNEEKLIVFCHNFIQDLIEIMKVDPVLPTEFLGPNWEGDNVLRIVDQFNKTVVPVAKQYLNKVFSLPD